MWIHSQCCVEPALPAISRTSPPSLTKVCNRKLNNNSVLPPASSSWKCLFCFRSFWTCLSRCFRCRGIARLFFCVWLIYLSIMSMRTICIVFLNRISFHLKVKYFIIFYWVLKKGSHVTQLEPLLGLNSWPCCLRYASVEISGVCHNAHFRDE